MATVLALTDELLDAIEDVRNGRSERIAKPGAWTVVREGDGRIRIEVPR